MPTDASHTKRKTRKADILALEQHTGQRQIAARRLFNAQLPLRPARGSGRGKTRRVVAPACPCKRPGSCACPR